jgi:hypothetical protein
VFWASFALAAAFIAPTSATSVQQWAGVNRAAIAKIHARDVRVATQRAFDATLARMASNVPASGKSASLRAAAAAELAVPGRYDVRDASVAQPGRTPWERFIDWLGKQWNRLMDALFGHVRLGGSGSAIFGDLLIFLVGCALVTVVARFLIVLQIDRAGRSTAFAPLEHQKNAHALYLQACALARDGVYDVAVQRLFLAAITALDLRGVLRENASATVGDMRRILRSRNAALISPFDEVAAPFVDATYAELPIVESGWAQARDAYARLTAMTTE